MKKTVLLICTSLLCLLFFNSLEIAKAEELPGKSLISRLSKNDITFHKKIKIILKGLNRKISNKDRPGVEKSFKSIENIRLGLLTKDIPFVAEYLRQRGENLVLSGSPELGFLVLSLNRKIFPQHYQTFFTSSYLYLFKSDLDIQNGILNFLEGAKISLSNKSRLKKTLSLIALFLLVVLIYAGYLYLTIHFIRNIRRFLNDIKKHFSFFRHWRFSGMSLFFLMMLPLFVGGGFCFVLSVPVFMWRYTEKSTERFIFIFAVMLFFLAYPVGLFIADNLSTSDQIAVEKTENFSNGIWDLETIRLFKNWKTSEENEYFVNTSLGLMNSWLGNLKTARFFYKKLSKKYPEDMGLIINGGNIKLRMNNDKGAIKDYTKAITIDSERVEPYYNMSLALEGTLEFDEADKFYKKAASIDQVSVARYLEMKNSGKTIPMDILPESPLLPLPGYFNERTIVFAERVWRLLLIPESLLMGGIALAGYLVLFFFVKLTRLLPSGQGSEQCPFCGTVVDSGAKCILCEALKLSPDRQDPTRREAGIKKIRRYRWFRDTLPVIFNFVMPGSGAVLDENDLSGIFMMFLSVALIACFIVSFFYFSIYIFSVAVIILYVSYSVICNILFIARR